VLLKQQEPEREQLALRNSFVSSLLQARRVISFLDLSSGISVSAENAEGTPEEKLLHAIFGEIPPNRFDRMVSSLLNNIVQGLPT
jgi:hypothetical protein